MAPASRGGPWRHAVAACAATVLIGIAVPSDGHAESAAMLTPVHDRSVTHFVLPTTADTEVALDAFRGRTVLVHFFATWCEPCKDELPALRRLAARAASDALAVLFISVAESDLRVRRFVETAPL